MDGACYIGVSPDSSNVYVAGSEDKISVCRAFTEDSSSTSSGNSGGGCAVSQNRVDVILFILVFCVAGIFISAGKEREEVA